MTTSRPTTAPRPAAAGFDDGAGRRGLQRMKRRASGLLAGAAAIFLSTFALPDTDGVEFLRAAAEAALVGGLADWFAVTALFRHPLGLPIPHTALIPRQKDLLAEKLGEFVAGNFLTPQAVAEHVLAAGLVERAGAYASDESRAAALAKQLVAPVTALLEATDSQGLADLTLETIRRDLTRRQVEGRSWAPRLGEFLQAAIEGRAQQPIVDVLVGTVREHLQTHRERWHGHIHAFLEGYGPLGRLVASHKRVDRILDHFLDTLADIEREGRGHPLRRSLDEALTKLAHELRHNPRHAVAVDAQLGLWAYDPRMEAHLHEVVADFLTSARNSLAQGGGQLETRLAAMIRKLGDRLTNDAEFAARSGALLDRAVRWSVAEYGDQLVTLIRTQVGSWNARDASRRIETAVGRDLQFIRINGTVIGALAGVAIHAVAVGIQAL